MTISADSVVQTEPVVGKSDGTSPDASLSPLTVRAERRSTTGRLYKIDFTATDVAGGFCRGSVTVCVPHDRNSECVAGPFDSTEVFDD